MSALSHIEAALQQARQVSLARAHHWTRHHPRPLSIDGHAYHRRTRNRKGRRR